MQQSILVLSWQVLKKNSDVIFRFTTPILQRYSSRELKLKLWDEVLQTESWAVLTEDVEVYVPQFDVAVAGDLGTTFVRSVVPHLQAMDSQTAIHQRVPLARLCISRITPTPTSVYYGTSYITEIPVAVPWIYLRIRLKVELQLNTLYASACSAYTHAYFLFIVEHRYISLSIA